MRLTQLAAILVCALVGVLGSTSAVGYSPAMPSAAAQSAAPGNPAIADLQNELRRLLVVQSSRTPPSAGGSVEQGANVMDAIGSADYPISSDQIVIDGTYPRPIDPTITTASIVSKRNEPRPGVQRWTVASPAMGRNMEVLIVLPRGWFLPAPMLYLLDGIGATNQSDILDGGWINRIIAEDNATIVLPTEANASLFADWDTDDPQLGRYKWETFLTEELPPLLEGQRELRFNGKSGVGGLSMGAGPAVHLANRHPDLYDGVIGISGCYSTLDPIGHLTTRIMVESRGGSLNNLWGAPGSTTREDLDTLHNPEGLRGRAIYLSAATGAVPDSEAGAPWQGMALSVLLEQGANACTRALDRRLTDAGIEHHVNYLPEGSHTWTVFGPQFQLGWEHIEPALATEGGWFGALSSGLQYIGS